MPDGLKQIFFTVSIVHTLISCIISSLSFTFPDFAENNFIFIIQVIGVPLLALEIGLGFTMNNHVGTIKLRNLKEIAIHYLKTKFYIDIVCLLTVVADIWLEGEVIMWLRICFFLKLRDALEKLHKLEVKFFDTTYKEHWWDLAKIFLTNFLFAHVLAIFLIMMTWMDERKSWLSKIASISAPWYEQYAWAYYGGTTIMLTVGFGDIAAANYKEAICLTFIETMSCITLAYNIHCVGTLISSIRNEEMEKNKKLKMLKNLSEKNNISRDLTFKINNFIKEASNIKKKFDVEENNKFIHSLPSSFKTDFLRESNKAMFRFLPFFNLLTDISLFKLAENIEHVITHPEETIMKGNFAEKIYILKEGEVGLCTRFKNSKFNNTLIDKVAVKEREKPLLLSLEFLAPEKTKNYEVKSKAYCILYTIDVSEFETILKNKDSDFQFYHEIKHRSKHFLNEFELIVCEFCNEKHSKFKCPRLHYVPLAQHILHRYIYDEKISKCKRRKVNRSIKYGFLPSSALKAKLMF